MLKKFVFGNLLAIICSGSSLAQNNKDSLCFSVGISAEAPFSFDLGNYGIGGNLALNFKHFKLSCGAYYDKYCKNRVNENYEISYLRLPFLIHFDLAKSNSLSFFINTGIAYVIPFNFKSHDLFPTYNYTITYNPGLAFPLEFEFFKRIDEKWGIDARIYEIFKWTDDVIAGAGSNGILPGFESAVVSKVLQGGLNIGIEYQLKFPK